MEEVEKFEDVRLAANGDLLPVWATQGLPDGTLGPGVRAWVRGGAVAVASPGLSGRDRLALRGPLGDAIPLAAAVLAEVGPSYRPFGAAELIAGLVEGVDGFGPMHTYYWMDTDRAPGVASDFGSAGWLDPDEAQAAAGLFDRHFPGSYAQPGRPGVRRWAAVRDAEGPLALAAEAWSGREAGFLAGVLTRPDARGRGLARQVCGFVLNALLERDGRAALMVHRDNAAAIRTYQQLGMRESLLGAADLLPTAGSTQHGG
jgi:GNAT superfamily N-acetyltransferase